MITIIKFSMVKKYDRSKKEKFGMVALYHKTSTSRKSFLNFETDDYATNVQMDYMNYKSDYKIKVEKEFQLFQDLELLYVTTIRLLDCINQSPNSSLN